MLKKMMKAVLAVALVAGMSATAMAETNIGGSLKAHFGQYTPAGDNAEAYLRAETEANLNFVAKHGPMTASVQQELKSIPAHFNNTRRTVGWQVSDMIGLKMGTVVTGVPFSIVSGLSTHTVPGNFIGVYYSFAESDGLNVALKLTDTINAEVTLYDADVLSQPFGGVAGTATQLGASGALMPGLAFKLSYVMSQDNNHNGGNSGDASGDPVDSSAYNLGFKYSMDMLSVSLDLFNKAKGEGDAKAGNAIQVKANAGPGQVIVTIASDAQGDAKNSWINAGYKIAVDKGAAWQAVYTTHTGNSGAAGAEDATESFIGAGFIAGF